MSNTLGGLLPIERSWFVVVESGIETGGWKPDPPTAGFDRNPALLGRVSRASIDTSIDNPKHTDTPVRSVRFHIRSLILLETRFCFYIHPPQQSYCGGRVDVILWDFRRKGNI
ncbi:MAG: hypothetical protein ABIL62_14430 [Planctomycetota bacterium]